MTARMMKHALTAALFVLFSAAPSRAQLPEWGSSEQERGKPPPQGPGQSARRAATANETGAAHAPLPPRGPRAPGESDEESPEVNRIVDGRQSPNDKDSKRPKPDYDGREETTTAGDVLIWVPRIVLFPLYFVSEFVVRRPLGLVVTAAERAHLPAILVDFFTFGPDRQAGIIPTGLIDFGLQPSVGLYFFWNDAFVEGNELRLRAATGGLNWWRFNALERYRMTDEHAFSVGGELSIRPDHVFHGFGPESRDQRARYKKDLLQVSLGYYGDLWRSSSVESFVAVRDVSFEPDTGCCDDPTLAAEVAAGRLVPPPGLDGYTVLVQGLAASLDSRPDRSPKDPQPGSDFVSPPGSGVLVRGRAAHAGSLAASGDATLAEPSRLEWVEYGATLGAFVDVTKNQRTIGLELGADFADPLFSDGEIPFTEQVTLGGDGPMRGFLEGRLIDRSAAVARLSYTWPVWVWFDGVLHYSVGNVFGAHLDGFELDLLRSSFGFGLQATGKRDHPFEILFAAGTDTFRNGAGIEHVRFVFGATSGF